MHRIIRNTILEYIPQSFKIEKYVNPARIYENNGTVQNGYIVYLCEREIRAKDNFALQFAKQKSQDLKLPLIVINPKINYESVLKQQFIKQQISEAKQSFDKKNIEFCIIDKDIQQILKNMKIALLVVDFNPIIRRDYLEGFNFKVYEIDGHNIIPAKFLTDKQEYNAATLRRKIYYNISEFITEFNDIENGNVESDIVLKDFIQNKLEYYAELKNNPEADIISDLSKYLNLGFISSQRVAIEVIKSDVSDLNKETFLEELIVRKELADNFCLYSTRFKTYDNIPNWAKLSLEKHKNDIRQYIYTINDFEFAKTHDKLWNSTQRQLLNEGRIHGYLRMYWAKKNNRMDKDEGRGT